VENKREEVDEKKKKTDLESAITRTRGLHGLDLIFFQAYSALNNNIIIIVVWGRGTPFSSIVRNGYYRVNSMITVSCI